MRKAQKNQIMEIMESLKQAHKEIIELVTQGTYEAAQTALADCQECMIEIGNAVEESEGEGCEPVKQIESYCETVFYLYNELAAEESISPKNMENNLQIAMNTVTGAMEKIQVKREVALFPYKASMWDSLESIYLAAKEDEDCEVYCVPVPYYDVKPNRMLGEMHYEGKEYPKNIEITDYETYNFEVRKPDIIYIHNPYDDWNLVTCVHPRFFSSNLKKYTDKLVYVPYFVLDEVDPNDQKRIDQMKHFCYIPGVINADRVILQSEDMRQIYIREFQRAALNNKMRGESIDKKKLEEKFLGLGSPKFDKVMSTKKEEQEIPTDWLRQIEKPDGSWKKIIFYNTSIGALLENNDKMLKKMRSVFRTYQENREQMTLLWRPHPLIQSTIETMRPALWEEYKKLAEEYRKEGWGIYDNTADVERAIAISDAYYGDLSSVVQMYQKTGKPILIQNVEIETEKAENER